MIYALEEFKKYAEITGFRKIQFVKAEEFLKGKRRETKQNVDIQFFDAELVATHDHLYFAVLNALQAFQNKTNISKSLAMETMLYASAQRQIQKAIQCCGIKPYTTNLAATLIGENRREIKAALDTIATSVGVEPDETVLEMSKIKEEKIRELFQITDLELKTVSEDEDCTTAVVNLIIERVALLSTQL